MLALLNYFVDLCLLRAKPQDLPESNVIFGLSLAANVLVGLMLVPEQFSGLRGLAQSLAEALLLLGVLRAALSVTGRGGRFLQSASAILGSSALLAVVTLPLLNWAGSSDTGVAEFAGLFLLGMIVWSLLVLGHILRHSFDLSLGRGVLFGVIYTFASYSIIVFLFPLN